MALRSKEWFFKQCLREARQNTNLADLSWSALDKGIGQEDSTRGHVTQAIGAIQGFLQQFPQHRAAIQAAPPTDPYDLPGNPAMLQDWVNYLAAQTVRRRPTQGRYGRPTFGYNLTTLRGYLPPSLGGRRRGGGGGGDEFKRVLRLMPEFWGRP